MNVTTGQAPMRHIPEEELHAYLDQALSRSQCVEIESHLAACAACQAARNEIAALRDRTTALLAKLTPPSTLPPPFEMIRSRTAVKLSARRRRIQWGAWAASVIAGTGVGWAAGSMFGTPRQASPAPPTPVVAAAPAPAAAVPLVPPDSASPAVTYSARPNPPARRPTATVAAAPVPHDSTARRKLSHLELPRPDSAQIDDELALDGAWRTMSWDGARAEAGEAALPHIDGLPVVKVQVQTNKEEGKRPVMVVAQQLTSGEVIRTIEGPASDVSRLLGRRVMTDPDPPQSPQPAGRGYANRAMAMQRGDRMLAITGALSPDSLRAMMQRLNAKFQNK